jgi:nucleoside-diphosphate-sugar epimerase
MKIAVIGSTGEIGSRLAIHLLKEKKDIKLLSRNLGIRLIRYEGLNHSSIDLLEKEKLIDFLQGIDCVVNCAIDKREYATEDESVNKNKEAIENLLDASEKAGVKRFIELSSIAVLPPQVTKDVLNNPFEYSKETDWYTRAKIENEKLVLNRKSKMDIQVIRAGIVYGPYLHWSKLAFLRTQGKVVVLPNVLNSICHAIHVDDLVGLIENSIFTDNPSTPKLIYGINPEIISWKDYYDFHGRFISNDFNVTDSISIESIELMNSIDGDELRKPGFKRSTIDIFRRTSYLIPSAIKRFKPVAKLIYLLKGMNFGLLNYPQYLNPKNEPNKQKIYPNNFELELYKSNAMPIQDLEYKFRIDFKDGTKNAANWWLKKIEK